MRIVLDTSDLAAKGFRFQGALYTESLVALRTQAADAYGRINAGDYWKNRTGNTRRSFKVVRTGGLALSLRSASKIAKFLEGGTRPHVIRAKPGGLLHFYWVRRGYWFSGKSVNHPGTKAKEYISKEGIIGSFELPLKGEVARDKAIDRSGLG